MHTVERFYEMLGLKPGASLKEVKQAYRDLVRIWHPDRFSHDPRLRQKAQEKLKEINEAYSRVESFLQSPEYREPTPPKNDAPKEKRREFAPVVQNLLMSLETQLRAALAMVGIKLHTLTFETRLKAAILLIALIYLAFTTFYLMFIR